MKWKIFLLFFLTVTTLFSNEIDDGIRLNSPKLTYTTITLGDVKIINNRTDDTISIWGHAMGSSSADFWVNDSILILSSGCCDATWFFKFDLKKDVIKQYKGIINNNIYTVKEVYDALENGGTQAAYKLLEDNLTKQKVHNRYIMSESFWRSEFEDTEK